MKIYIVYGSVEADYEEIDENRHWNIIATKSEKEAEEIVSKLTELHQINIDFLKKEDVNTNKLIDKRNRIKYPEKPLDNKGMKNWQLECEKIKNISKYLCKDIKDGRKKFKEENYKIPEHLLDVYKLEGNVLEDGSFEYETEYDYHELDLL
jgi:hypothetical protein